MYTKLSELVKISSFLQTWNGNQSSKIKTVNSKLKKYHEKREDSLINVTILKILEEYDYTAYLKSLQNGVSFFYQLTKFEFKLEYGFIVCNIYGKDGRISSNVRISDTQIFFDKKPSNADNYSLIMSLYSQNKKGNYRKSNI